MLTNTIAATYFQLDPRAMTWLNKKSTMMVGIDVTHPGPGSREGTPSIAAVVASVDQNFVQFPASLRVQKVDRTKLAKEKLDELRDMMIERLEVYRGRNNGKLPDRIFVYRDGVSEVGSLPFFSSPAGCGSHRFPYIGSIRHGSG